MRNEGNIMIKMNSALLENVIKSLDLNNQVRVNSKYMELINHIGEENKEKVERLISAYIFQYLIKNNSLIENLISSNSFLNKVSFMTNEQIEGYIELCIKARFGSLITNEILLNMYDVEEHLRICELHLDYKEDALLSSIIEIAAKYKVRFLYIKRIAEIVSNPKMKDRYIIDLLLKEEFYAIKSDFERLIILEYIAKADNEYEKSLYKYLASNEIFVENNDIYYLIGLVEKIIELDDQCLGDQLIMEIKDTPSITSIYSPKDFYIIMKRIREDARVKYFFFNPFILANFKAEDIEIIYNLVILNNPDSIVQVILELERYKKEKKDVIYELQKNNIGISSIMKTNPHEREEQGNKPVSFAYKIARGGEWIDA